MTFASPWVLAFLVGLPLLAALYVWRNRAGRQSEAFAAAHMLTSVQPRQPGWRRHAPVFALLIALGILIVAAARPQKSVAVSVERTSIMLATDVSGSMHTKDVAPDRLTAAKRAVRSFLDSVPPKVNVGIMAFNQTPTVLQSPTTDRAAARSAVDGMKISGGTATGDAVQAAARSLAAMPRDGARRPPSAIVLLSDGESTRGSDPVEAAKAAGAQGTPVYTVALGTGQGTDPTTLQAMAEASGGRFFTVDDASELNQVYERLGSQLSTASKKRQVTAWFAGGGLLMLLTAGAMSLRWFGRLV